MGKFFVYILFIVASLVFTSCRHYKQSSSSIKKVSPSTQKLHKKHRAILVDVACKQLKTPYKWGGNSPKGFDCSGFTSYCYSQLGVQIPRTAIEQSLVGKKVRAKRVKAGDLIFFKGSDKKQKKVAHVGIVVSGRKKNIKFVHAASKGVMMSQLSEEYFSKRFKTIRRISKGTGF